MVPPVDVNILSRRKYWRVLCWTPYLQSVCHHSLYAAHEPFQVLRMVLTSWVHLMGNLHGQSCSHIILQPACKYLLDDDMSYYAMCIAKLLLHLLANMSKLCTQCSGAHAQMHPQDDFLCDT